MCVCVVCVRACVRSCAVTKYLVDNVHDDVVVILSTGPWLFMCSAPSVVAIINCSATIMCSQCSCSNRSTTTMTHIVHTKLSCFYPSTQWNVLATEGRIENPFTFETLGRPEMGRVIGNHLQPRLDLDDFAM